MFSGAHARILASTAFILSFSISSPVQAAESNLTMGHGLICDTVEQVQAVLAPGADDILARLTRVNERYGKGACNVVTVVFYKGDEAATMLIPEGVVHVFKVQIIGVKSGPGWLRMDMPMDQFTAILDAAITV